MTGSSPRIQLISQFGEPVRGVSPYADALFQALQDIPDLQVHPVDYRSPYPDSFHPGGTGTLGVSAPADNGIHWLNPWSWKQIADCPHSNIVHIQHWLAPMAIYLAPIARLCKRAGKRVVTTVHNPVPHEAIPGAGRAETNLLKQSDVLVVHDQRARGSLARRLGCRAPRIDVIPHGIKCLDVPVRPTYEDYQLLGTDPARRHACIFGNLRGYKGIETLIVAWKTVANRVPDVDLIIAGRMWSGRGPGARIVGRLLRTHDDSRRIQAALEKPGLRERIHLREGFMPDATIDALIRQSALAIFPYSRFSSQSGAACRAAGLGCPLLVSDVGGLPELAIDSSWVVPPDDADQLARTLIDKLTISHKPENARIRQLDTARIFSWSRVAHLHAAVYRDIVS